MDKKEIQELLDKTYELEGLLHLAAARSEDMPEVLPGLIRTKVAELYGMTGGGNVAEPVIEPVIVTAHEDEMIESPADEPIEEIEETTVEEPVGSPIHEMTGLFSLNDRFLFIRELFNGSPEAFDNALTKVAGMDSVDEAEEYFYDECGMNPADPSVEAFMKIIEKCF